MSVHAEAAAKALEYAREVLRALDTVRDTRSNLASLAQKLEAFVADPATIGDDYWSPFALSSLT